MRCFGCPPYPQPRFPWLDAFFSGGDRYVDIGPASVERPFPGRKIASPGADGWAELGKLPGVHQATTATTPTTVELKVSLEEEPAIGAVVQRLVTSGGRILTLKKVEPTLEDVFIELVGHGLADEETGGE